MSNQNIQTPEKLKTAKFIEAFTTNHVTLSPYESSTLSGRYGTEYKLIALNTDSVLSAAVYAYNGDNSVMNNINLNPDDSAADIFQMNSKGQIKVFNWTNSKSQNPKVTFLLIALD
ncbi:MAG: hypothetical protein JKY44_08135 [Flavobacteriaceae bacterium]|nr:hypothetical protein [Flavobacteriaceae bacterium]